MLFRSFGHSNLEIVSDFVFRASNFDIKHIRISMLRSETGSAFYNHNPYNT